MPHTYRQIQFVLLPDATNTMPPVVAPLMFPNLPYVLSPANNTILPYRGLKSNSTVAIQLDVGDFDDTYARFRSRTFELCVTATIHAEPDAVWAQSKARLHQSASVDLCLPALHRRSLPSHGRMQLILPTINWSGKIT